MKINGIIMMGALSVYAINLDKHHSKSNKKSIFSKYNDVCTLNLERVFDEESSKIYS